MANVDDVEGLEDRERYFADPTSPALALLPGAQGHHCRNIRLALIRLGYRESFRYAPLTDVFDDAVSAELMQLQADRGHTSVDGLCGPGTRRLLVKALIDHVRSEGTGVDPFARMVDPERRGEGKAFVSHAHEDRTYVEALVSLIGQWGYVAWFDAHLSGAEKFSETLMLRIESAYLLIVFETPHAVRSKWVYREVEYAHRRSVPILSIENIPIAEPNALSKILDSYHRLGAAPKNLTAPSAKAYRAALKQAARHAHNKNVGLDAPGTG